MACDIPRDVSPYAGQDNIKKDYVELHRLRNVTAGNNRGGNERGEREIPTSFPNPVGLVKPTQSIKTYPIDLETSGGKNHENRIIQFASTIINEDGSNTASIDDNLNQVTINPQCVINYWSTKANGITNKETNDKPVFSQVIDDVMIMVPYGGTVVSHSAEYNIRMLFLECVRLSDPKYMEWLESIQSIDTMKISRDLWKSEKRHSLDALCLRMGFPARHKRSSAGQDARIIALLWNKMKSGADHGEFPYSKYMEPVPGIELIDRDRLLSEMGIKPPDVQDDMLFDWLSGIIRGSYDVPYYT